MIYAFAEYDLDVPRYELRYAGKVVKLEPQVFNVLGQLCKEPEGQELIALLVRRAPTWMVQMPWREDAGPSPASRRARAESAPAR
jgi:hypothetical protein